MNGGPLSQEEIDALLRGREGTGAGGEAGTGGEAGAGSEAGAGGATGAGSEPVAGGVTGAGGEAGAGSEAGTGGATGTGGEAGPGGDADPEISPTWPPPGSPVSEDDMDVLAEVANISMGSAATAVSALVSRKVVITAPTVSISTPRDVWEQFELPTVVVQVSYIEGLTGRNLFILRPRDAAVIADLMMGGDGQNPSLELDEMRLSAVSEAMNQMMGASSTAMSDFFKLRVNISAPDTRLTEAGDRSPLSSSEPMLAVTFRLRIEDLIDSNFVQLMPFPFALNLVNMARAAVEGGLSYEDAAATAEALVAPPTEEPGAAAVAGEPVPGEVVPGEPVPGEAVPGEAAPTSPVVPAAQQGQPGQPAPQRAVFSSFDTPEQAPAPQPSLQNVSVELIRHIPVEVSVSLGQAEMAVKDVLRLTSGAIVQLNTQEHDLVRIFANGVEIARGEVVVVGEQYGVRITDIVTPAQRLTSLGG